MLFQEKIFLGIDVKLIFDEKRKQMNFSYFIKSIKNEEERNRMKEILDKITQEMENYLKQLNPSYKLHTGNIIMSLESSDSQAWHTDFDPDQVLKFLPLVFFLAISPCRLDFQNENKVTETVVLNSGTLLTFNGFAIHRGCRYKKPNFRIHWYAYHEDDTKSIKKIGQNTYIF